MEKWARRANGEMVKQRRRIAFAMQALETPPSQLGWLDKDVSMLPSPACTENAMLECWATIRAIGGLVILRSANSGRCEALRDMQSWLSDCRTERR